VGGYVMCWNKVESFRTLSVEGSGPFKNFDLMLFFLLINIPELCVKDIVV